MSKAFALGLSPAPIVTFPAALPKIPYGGFSPVRLQTPGTRKFSDHPSWRRGRVKSDPDIPRLTIQFGGAFGAASAKGDSRLNVRDLGFNRATRIQRSSLRRGYSVPALNACRPHPPVRFPPAHFPARLVISPVFDIQGSSCLVTRPSELSLLGFPGLPSSTSAGRSDTCIFPFFRIGIGYRLEGRNSWHLQFLRLNQLHAGTHFDDSSVRFRYGPPGCSPSVLTRPR